MPNTAIRAITDFESLRDFLEDELDWNLSGYSFDDLTFTCAAEELGLKPEEAAGVKAMHQLRPLSGRQPWGTPSWPVCRWLMRWPQESTSLLK